MMFGERIKAEFFGNKICVGVFPCVGSASRENELFGKIQVLLTNILFKAGPGPKCIGDWFECL